MTLLRRHLELQRRDSQRFDEMRRAEHARTGPGVTIKEAAALLGVTPRTIKSRQKKGKMPERFKLPRYDSDAERLYRKAGVIMLARTWHYRVSDIEKMIADRNGSAQP
jgi:hypothetical protein